MGLDYGTKTVGVAVSDELLLTARALETIRRERENHLRKTLTRIETLCAEYDIGKIIVGLPLHLDMRPGDMARKASAFRKAVADRTGIGTELWDERLTSGEASGILRINGIGKTDEKQLIDMVAAKVILESYLENHRGEIT